MDHDGVSVAGEAHQFGQLWLGNVLAGGLVAEGPVQGLAVQLGLAFWSRVLTLV
ncbi:hypothetical protein [Arthrobacter sp. ZGTC412]|uniref:hypothetical protein n=1 Tax=Arthrobacter sp. ZGTC412 TaxID=2058900 RepID=UPI003F8D0A80